MNNEKICTEQYVESDGKRLRCGFTTGSAAAMATVAALGGILEGEFSEYVKITTPKGWSAVSEVLDGKIISENSAIAAIKKDAGDDPDATDGIKIFSEVTVEKTDEKENGKCRIEITGGEGIGIVTKAGLDQPPGEYAINSVPRKMIEDEVRRTLGEHGGNFFVKVKISAENGKEIAKNTFNPVLGIKDGISILGTTGVVMPMSEEALVDSIYVEMKFLRSNFKSSVSGVIPLIVTPGNFGNDFLQNFPELENAPIIRCSNYIGKAIDFACELGFTHVLFVGHAGKFVKIAGGIMNTHSHNADCRMEIIACHASLARFDSMTQTDIARIMNAATVDAALDILDESDSSAAVCKSIAKAAEKHIARRSKGRFKFSFMMFSNTAGRGILSKSKNWDENANVVAQSLTGVPRRESSALIPPTV